MAEPAGRRRLREERERAAAEREARQLMDVPDEWLQAAFDAIGRSASSDGDEQVRHVITAIMPLLRQRVAGDIERYAESIGWYEGGGVWADAIHVAQNGKGWGEDD